MADGWTTIVRRVSRAVRDRRLALEMSQPDLARRSGVSLRRVQQIEADGDADTLNPSLRALYLIARALDLDVVELLSPQPRDRPARKRAPRKDKETKG
ncbi:MAG TPA: helix-turn-helix transcriptional regulator [Candidatus Sulfotelmatobacter sp.]|nr:helix-turn-helix transcriptional regulator [Candidatus Sulfotelmatobacter sp.]